jgi:hypothetical protein
MSTILQGESRMPSLARASEWLNSEPLTPADLHGRVVLIDFGTYTARTFEITFHDAASRHMSSPSAREEEQR